MSVYLRIALSPLSRSASPATPLPSHSVEPQHNAATTTAMLDERWNWIAASRLHTKGNT